MRLLCVVLAGCAAAAESYATITWSKPLEIATGGGEKGPWRQNDSRFDYVDDPSVVLDARGTASVVWVDHRVKDVLFQQYPPTGKGRLAKPVNISRSPAIFSWLPRVALSPVHANDIYVVWQEIIFSGGSHGGDLLFARSIDGGKTFEPPLNLSSSVAGDGKARIDRETWHNGSLDLAVGGDGAIVVAWTEYEGRLWVRRSTDRGASFAEPLLVAGRDKLPARAPSLAMDGDRSLYLAWTVGEDSDADIRLAWSGDGGATFEPPKIVATTPGYSDAPKLAVSPDGTLHLAYAESDGGPLGTYRIQYTRSLDRGETFEPARTISNPQPRDSRSSAFPMLAVAGEVVHIVWELFPDPRERSRGLGIVTSRDGGTTFVSPSLIPGTRDRGWNGSHQGRLMRKLAVDRTGSLAVVNSSLVPGERSRVWLVRGRLR